MESDKPEPVIEEESKVIYRIWLVTNGNLFGDTETRFATKLGYGYI